ncbi:MAG: sulfatase [Flavobacteriaceae bacterium]
MGRFKTKSIIVCLVLLLFSCHSTVKKVESPNIVLIVADDLGWTDLSYMGSKYYETPNIDKLSKSGITFYNGYASSANCAPSRATMMTGRYHTDHGIYTVSPSARGNNKTRKLIPVKNKQNLDLDFFLIPEMLKEKGYVNAHIGKWHLGSKDFYPEKNGFDINVGGWEKGSPKGGYFAPYKNPKLKDGPVGEYLTDRLGDEALKFINKNINNKFFLHLSFHSVHTPIQSKKEYISKYSKKPPNKYHNRPDYSGMIQSLDENIGRVLNEIKKLGLSKNTLVIFTSDNGGIRAISNQFPLKAGKGSYYEGGIRVPLIFSWEGKIESGKKSYERVSNIDFYPTIKRIINYKNDNLELDGVDLNPIFNGKKIDKRPLFFHFPIYLEAYSMKKDDGRDPLFRTRPGSVIIKENWKLHHYFEDNALELYNLDLDVSESKDLSKENLDKTKELFDDLEKWRKLKDAPIPNQKNTSYSQKYVDSLILKNGNF